MKKEKRKEIGEDGIVVNLVSKERVWLKLNVINEIKNIIFLSSKSEDY